MNPLLGNGRFESVECLGRGWNGSVHKVLDRKTGAVLAAKVLDVLDPERLFRLKQEFRSLARLRHRNLIELYELVVNPNECFFTMELIEGTDFLRYVRGEGADDPEKLLERFRGAARQLVTGLVTLHASGTLHRDLKPTNVLVDRGGRLALLDFGLSAALAAGGESGELVGTAGYMAPEQTWGLEVGAPADWYAVGIMLYEALSGELPYRAGDPQTAPPPSLRSHAAWVPAEIDEAVLALLRFDAAERPGAEELLSCFEPASKRRPAPAPLRALEVSFVGRAAEHAELRRAFDAVGAGPPVVVHVHGPSGIGKTELVRRFLDEVERDESTVVLRGRCHAQETVPFNAFDGLVDALSGFLRNAPEPGGDRPSANAAALLRLFPVLARVPSFAALEHAETPAEPRELRRMAFAAMRELVAEVAKSRRLVLWIDDAQWCDEDSRALARELLRAPDAASVLLVLTHRSEDRERVPFAAAEEGVAVARAEISLGPLAVEESRELARLLSGGHQELNEDAVAAQAAGSPFFVAALVRQQMSARQDGVVPADLAEVLRLRVEELPAAEQRLLEVVSVAGQPIERAVALEASNAGLRSWTLLINLEKENLLRTVTVRDQEGIEIYHDRIRQALLTGLSTGDLRERHHSLAESLSARPDPDAGALFRHFLGAEELAPAAHWGVEAADRADRALAFAEAADLFAKVLPLVADENKREIGLRRAEALVNAGHGAEAAPIFLAAAPEGAPEERLELRRRAAEQFLVTGHMDEGVEVVRELLAACGVRYPRTPFAATAGAAVRLLAIRWRGLDVPQRAHPRGPTIRADACFAAFKGLAQVDPMRGIYFGVRGLSLSLAAADRFRIARDLMSTGAALIALRGPVGRWAEQMIDRAREIADDLRDPYLTGHGSTVIAQVAMVEGRWREMLEHCDAGADVLRRHCRGVGWELDVARMASLRALEELGDFPEMDRRVQLMLRDAENANDVYGTVLALGWQALGRLFNDDLGTAREIGLRIVRLWTVRGVHMQHFYAFRLECYRELCEGRPADAWLRIGDTWPSLQRSNLLRHVLLRLDGHLLRARAALALAASDPTKRESLLRGAEKDADRLEREGRPDTAGHAFAIRAACRAQRGDATEATNLLERARERFGAAGMAVCEAYASLRTAQLSGRDDRAAAAISVLTEKGVANPARLAAMYAPGFPKLRGS